MSGDVGFGFGSRATPVPTYSAAFTSLFVKLIANCQHIKYKYTHCTPRAQLVHWDPWPALWACRAPDVAERCRWCFAVYVCRVSGLTLLRRGQHGEKSDVFFAFQLLELSRLVFFRGLHNIIYIPPHLLKVGVWCLVFGVSDV